jgi:hypothetical protein
MAEEGAGRPDAIGRLMPYRVCWGGFDERAEPEIEAIYYQE